MPPMIPTEMVSMLGNAKSIQPSFPETKLASKPTTQAANTTAAQIKAVGGLGNWYKLFPAKTGKWTQVTIAQIRTVEANQVPKPLHTKPVEPFNLQGSFQVLFGTGAKSGATYALVTRKDPKLGTLSAWYARDIDIARIVGSGLKKVNKASDDYTMAAAQDMAIQSSVNQAKANLQGGPTAPSWVPTTPSSGLSVPQKTGYVKIPPVAWYEVAESLILKVEKELPSKPSIAPIPMPTGKGFTAELLAGPKNKWPYAKVVANINGVYVTAWFTIGMAGKNRPGSIILLKRPKVAGSTPNPSLEPSAGYVESTDTGTGIIRQQPREMLSSISATMPTLPLTMPLASEDGFIPPGFGEGVVSEGGIDFEIGDAVLSSDTPFWKNPLVWAGAAVLAGGIWFIAKK